MKTIAFVLIGLALVSGAPRARADAIWNVRIAEGPIAAIQHNQNVNISFAYEVTTAGGVRIFARPMSGGSLSPNYVAHPSPVYAVGRGTSSGWFTITTGNVTVDQIRFEVWDDQQTTILLRFYIPVHMIFSSNALYNIVLDRNSPSTIQFSRNLNSSFSYTTSDTGGVQIFMRPFTNGILTPNYSAHGSPVYPTGSGTGSGYFTILAGTADVDSVRFQMYNHNQTALLLELFIPGHFLFSPYEISNIVFTPRSPEGLLLSENVSASFDYFSSDTGGVRIWMRPFTNGALSPSYAAHGSSVYPVGNGPGAGYFTITAGDVTVDSARFQITNAAQTVTHLEFYVPVSYHFGGHRIDSVSFLPPSPAYCSNGHLDSVNFRYTTVEPGGVYIFPRPVTAGILSQNYSASPSPLYSTGSGRGSGWYTITAGETHVDRTRIRMTNAAQSATLLDWDVPVSYFFGVQTLVGVNEVDDNVPQTFALRQNFPNPFNPGTTIEYDVPQVSHIVLKVYNTLGQDVATLVDGPVPAGEHRVRFDGHGLASGVYFCRLIAGPQIQVKKMLLLK